MKPSVRLLSALALTTFVQLTQAHDPAEHAKEAAAKNAAPDYASMKNMEHSKTEPSDPVMKAMMARCGDAVDHKMEGMDHSQMGNRPAPSPASKPGAHGSH